MDREERVADRKNLIMIPYGRQDISQADIDEVVGVLRSDFLTQGPQVPRFEKAVREKVGTDYALAVNSATSALHIACLALELSDGDLLWTSPITFVASANCGLYCGADVDFIDIDPRNFNLCPTALEAKLVEAEAVDRLPKVVVVVHMCGQSADMEKIAALGNRYGFHIVEDASHAIGGEYQGAYIGNCRFSDIVVFSFHPVKIITTAEGGMAVTNDPVLAQKMELYRSHGVTRDPSLMTREPDGPWYYQQVDLGYNYRMTDLQAALGLSQMHRLDAFVTRRHELAERYDRLLNELPLVTPWRADETYSAFHLYVVRLRLDKITQLRREVFEALRAMGIGINVHYIPVHTQPHYSAMGFKLGDYPEAERYYEQAISLPLFATMTNDQQDKVVQALQKVL